MRMPVRSIIIALLKLALLCAIYADIRIDGIIL